MSFPEKLTELRKARGLEVYKIAVKLEISRQAYERIEACKNPKYKTLKKLATLFNVTEDYFFNDLSPAEFDTYQEFRDAANYYVKLENPSMLECIKIAGKAKIYQKAQEEAEAKIGQIESLNKRLRMREPLVNQIRSQLKRNSKEKVQ